LLATSLPRPAEAVVRLRRVADQPVKLGCPALKRGIHAHVVVPVEPYVTEGALDELTDRVVFTGCDDVVPGLVLLQHQPHRAHVVTRIAPVTARVEIAQHELVLETERDRRGAVRDLARQELQWSSRRLVVVEDAGAGEETVLATIGMHDEMRVGLRDAVGRYRLQRSLLGLRTLARLAEDFARGGLVEADGRVFGADRFEQRGCANRGELGRVDGAVP